MMPIQPQMTFCVRLTYDGGQPPWGAITSDGQFSARGGFWDEALIALYAQLPEGALVVIG